MISCLLLLVQRSPAGLPTCSEIRVAGESIQLGRGAACQIHLPDHRVCLLHATLSRSGNGALQIEAAPDVLIGVDGFLEQSAVLSPGIRLVIGPYHLTVEPARTDADITLSIDRPGIQADGADTAQADPVTLAALGISKRRLGAMLAAFILLALLLLPMLSRLSPAFEQWQATLPVALTGLFIPGPLSAGHGAFGMKCSTCHRNAFEGVADVACTKCHERVGMHLAANTSHKGELGEVRCADCHPVHAGGLAAKYDGFVQCLACHKRLGKPDADASDFGSDHPPFHLEVAVGKNLVRVRQDANKLPAEQSGLKFSHQLHLDKKGISSPDGDTVLTCRGCHKLEESGNHFAPMTMKMTCQQSRCHTIRFRQPVRGVVPHGSEREVMNSLRNFYMNWLADSPEDLARECVPAAKPGTLLRRTVDCADGLAYKRAASSLFRTTGESLECALCHEVAETGKPDVPWKIAELNINRDWQRQAVFRHARHDTMACADCHDKSASKLSEDVSFPGIQKCRECHAGTEAAPRKTRSSCPSCHQFHRVAGHSGSARSARPDDCFSSNRLVASPDCKLSALPATKPLPSKS